MIALCLAGAIVLASMYPVARNFDRQQASQENPK